MGPETCTITLTELYWSQIRTVVTSGTQCICEADMKKAQVKSMTQTAVFLGKVNKKCQVFTEHHG